MFCTKCGAQGNTGAQFCTTCGATLAAPAGAVATPALWTPPATVNVRASYWIGQGWDIVKADMGMFFLLAFVSGVISSAVPLILQGAMIAGLHIYIIKRILGRRAEFGDLFLGFNYFVPTLVASLLIALFVTAGTLLCIIPGLVVASMYKFTYLFIVDKRLDFWPAMQASHEVVKRDYFGFTMFFVLMILVDLLGLLCCVFGLFIAIPVTVAAVTVAYKDLVGFDPQTVETL
ncbi:MAG TPA: zinc-ribbon domain-containing protein [Bryobacteraceae bacterium]|nr:zinc-ribbon domain-containing protein [Bryobacteraceae bacterium]